MFTEHKAPGEVQQITKLSQAIRIGALTILEDKTWRGCALATAARAMGWDQGNQWADVPYDFLLSKFPNFTPQELANISLLHIAGRSREQIASDLEARGL